MFRFLALSATLLFAAPATAQDRFSDTRIAESRDWTVFRTLDRQENESFCFARTLNGNGTALILGGFPDQTFELALTDRDWDLSGSVDFFIVIDRSRWSLTGTGDGTSLSVRLSNFDQAGDFLNELRRGNSVRLLDDSESEVGQFSLRGSSNAIGVLLECWEEVIAKGPPVLENEGQPAPTQAGPSDPFRHRSLPSELR